MVVVGPRQAIPPPIGTGRSPTAAVDEASTQARASSVAPYTTREGVQE